jgi:hypothetical protein
MLDAIFVPITVVDESWLGWVRHDGCRKIEIRKKDSGVYPPNELEEVGVTAVKSREPVQTS